MEMKGASLDYLNFQDDPEVMKIIGNDEPIFYTGKIHKINQYSFSQKRIIVITTARLYNFREKSGKKKLKRAIPIAAISGITKSLNK